MNIQNLPEHPTLSVKPRTQHKRATRIAARLPQRAVCEWEASRAIIGGADEADGCIAKMRHSRRELSWNNIVQLHALITALTQFALQIRGFREQNIRYLYNVKIMVFRCAITVKANFCDSAGRCQHAFRICSGTNNFAWCPSQTEHEVLRTTYAQR